MGLFSGKNLCYTDTDMIRFARERMKSMAKIEEIDKNFAASAVVGEYVYRSVWDIPGVLVEGLYPGTFCRMNPAELPKMTPGVQNLAWCTSGGCIRFRAKGRKFGVRMTLRSGDDMSHMARTGSAGLDVYVGLGSEGRFVQSTRPGSGETFIETEVNLPFGQDEVTLWLPLYNGVNDLQLGFFAGEEPAAPMPHRRGKALFYGSSITQGGCASRTGNSHVNMLARMLDCGIHNLGFSGQGKGEQVMAEYIAGLDFDVLVLEYDHNAPTAAHLKETHLPFLQTILKKHPDLPVLMVSKPDFGRTPEDSIRRDIIKESWRWTRERGMRTAFIDGARLFDGPMSDSCTVDGCHPNDLGFYRMAMGMLPTLKDLLDGEEAYSELTQEP